MLQSARANTTRPHRQHSRKERILMYFQGVAPSWISGRSLKVSQGFQLRTHTHTHANTHIHTQTHRHTHKHIYKHARTHARQHVHARTHAHTHRSIESSTHMHTQVNKAHTHTITHA